MVTFNIDAMTPKVAARAAEVMEILKHCDFVVFDVYREDGAPIEALLSFEFDDTVSVSEQRHQFGVIKKFLRLVNMHASPIARTMMFEDDILVFEQNTGFETIPWKEGDDSWMVEIKITDHLLKEDLQKVAVDFDRLVENLININDPAMYVTVLRDCRTLLDRAEMRDRDNLRFDERLAAFRKKNLNSIQVETCDGQRIDYSTGFWSNDARGDYTVVLGVQFGAVQPTLIAGKVRMCIYGNSPTLMYVEGEAVTEVSDGKRTLKIKMNERMFIDTVTYPEEIIGVPAHACHLNDAFVERARQLACVNPLQAQTTKFSRETPLMKHQEDQILAEAEPKAPVVMPTHQGGAVQVDTTSNLYTSSEYYRMLDLIYRGNPTKYTTLGGAADELNKFIEFVKSH